MTQVQVIPGDISAIESDAVITAINSQGVWNGGIDKVIKGVASNHFHDQARAALPLSQGQTVATTGSGSVNRGKFKNVVFVIDDLQSPLRDVVRNGLQAASDAGYKSVTLPTIRMGLMIGIVEGSPREAASETAEGIQQFIRSNPNTSIDNISLVVYGDVGTQNLLGETLRLN